MLRCSSSRRMMPLQLDVRAPVEDAADLVQHVSASTMPPFASACAIGPSSPPVRQCSPAACCSMRSHVNRASPFGRFERAGRDQLAEIP